MKSLTSAQKNFVDTALLVLGSIAGWFVSNAGIFPEKYQAVVVLAGGGVGYFVSDAVTFVQTGAFPTGTIKTQALSLWQTSRTPVENEIKALVKDPTQQAIALAVLDSLEAQLTAQLQTPATPTSPLALAVAGKTTP